MIINETIVLGMIAFFTLGLIFLVAYLAYWARKSLWDLDAKLSGMTNNLETLKKDFHCEISVNLPAAIENNTIATQNAVAIGNLAHKFPVFLGDASIDGFHARALIQYLVENRPRVIVELGSGSSTILIAETLKALGIQDVFHLSVDHHARYLSIAERWAELAGVADRVTFLHAPLMQYEGHDCEWYSGVTDPLQGRKIELVFVDGPCAYEAGKELARYPAMPALHPYFADHCAVILDDANRQGEQMIIKRWLTEYPEFRIENTVELGKGATILKRGSDENP